MLIILSSDNDKFSFLIGKNPSSPPKVISERKGAAVGWYHTPQTYCVNFVDGVDEVSYPDYLGQDFEYLAAGKYCHSFLGYKLISEFFKLYDEYDNVNRNLCTISGLRCKEKTIKLFEKYFSNIVFNYKTCNTWNKYHQIWISTESTLAEFISFLRIFLFYITIDNEKVWVHEEQIETKFKELANIDAPYFVRYLYKTNLIRNSKDKFNNNKVLLNQSIKNKYEFSQFSNFESRMKFVKDHVQNMNVIDIGCGEGRFIKPLLGQNNQYIGIDIDYDCREKCKMKSKYVDKKVEVFESINELQTVGDNEYENYNLLLGDDEDRCVVLTEVIEHIDECDLFNFFNEVKSLNPKKIIITTPNADFNINYMIDEMRHEDHRFEWNVAEFRTSIRGNFAEYNIEFIDIGDKVNDVCTTFGAVLIKKEK